MLGLVVFESILQLLDPVRQFGELASNFTCRCPKVSSYLLDFEYTIMMHHLPVAIAGLDYAVRADGTATASQTRVARYLIYVEFKITNTAVKISPVYCIES